MHSATELILARMDSNPEEFEDSINGRWGSALIKLSEAAPEWEWELVKNKLKDVRMEVIHKQIMQELCAPNDPRQMELFKTAEILREWGKGG